MRRDKQSVLFFRFQWNTQSFNLISSMKGWNEVTNCVRPTEILVCDLQWKTLKCVCVVKRWCGFLRMLSFYRSQVIKEIVFITNDSIKCLFWLLIVFYLFNDSLSIQMLKGGLQIFKSFRNTFLMGNMETHVVYHLEIFYKFCFLKYINISFFYENRRIQKTNQNYC